jgi:hypothetical protein
MKSGTHYIVSQDGHNWHVSFRGTVLGPFSARETAIEAAIEDASGRPDRDDLEVQVRDTDARTVTVWKARQV